MGIYPTDTFDKIPGSDWLVRTENWFDGTIKTTYYEPVLMIDVRTDCFCCSCGDREGSDPACRNHGWAAKRPCEVHEMPGTVWDDASLPGEGPDPWANTMPESVQEIRRLEREREELHEPPC